MSEWEALTTEKQEYMNDWVKAGNKVIDLVNDKTFLDFLRKEDDLIAELNKQARCENCMCR